jgi:hypothetical protein
MIFYQKLTCIASKNVAALEWHEGLLLAAYGLASNVMLSICQVCGKTSKARADMTW